MNDNRMPRPPIYPAEWLSESPWLDVQKTELQRANEKIKQLIDRAENAESERDTLRIMLEEMYGGYPRR